MNTKKLNRVFSSSIIYSVSGILEKCFSFFLLPLYTRYLTTEDYGITDISRTFLNVMIYIAGFSLYSAVNRNYVEYKDEPEKLKRFYGTISSFVLLSCIIIFILLTIFRVPLSNYVFSGADYYPVILLTLLTLIFQCQYTIYSYILRSQQKALKVSILNLAWFLFRVGLNIYLVVGRRWGAQGVLTATLAADMAYTLYFWIDTLSHKEMEICIDRNLLKEALSYSLPIMPHNLSTHIVSLVSKVLIGSTSGSLAGVGVYAVASSFRTVTDTLHVYINHAYTPWMFERLHNKETEFRTEIRNIVRLLISATGFILTGIAIFSQDYITLFIDKSYQDAKIYSVLIVIVYIIKTAYYYYVTVLFYYKDASRKIFIATLSSSLLNLLLSAFFIPRWNVIGSIAADMIAMVVRVGIVVIMANRYDRVGLEIKDFLFNIASNLIVIAIGIAPTIYFKFDTFNIWNFLFRILLMILYFGFLIIQNRSLLKTYNISSKAKHLLRRK